MTNIRVPKRKEPVELVDVAAEVVRVYSGQIGREPTTTRTVWRDDVVVCVLEGVFSPEEERLVAGGDLALVRAERQTVHELVEPRLREAVEAVTKRPVLASVSQVDGAGIAFEIFLLGRGAADDGEGGLASLWATE